MKFRLSSEYGELSPVRDHVHRGIDLAMPEGTTLRSIAEGTVEKVVDYGSTNLGKGVFIRHDDGTLSIYGHMKDTSAVHVGEHVSAGEIIGLSGNTGHSTGAHLHYAIKDANGQFVDPTPIAEKVDAMSGAVGDVATNFGIFEPIGGLGALIGSTVKDSAKEKAKEVIYDWLGAGLEVLCEVIGAVALIGSGVTLIMYVAGWRDGARWTGMLFTANILLKYLFGGI
jgi:hypothetical protein